jgi:translation initiation factor RLI1
MQKKWANIDFTLCQPQICRQNGVTCRAASVCPHKLLEQDKPIKPPMLLSAEMCVGCGNCAGACPLKAVSIVRG